MAAAEAKPEVPAAEEPEEEDKHGEGEEEIVPIGAQKHDPAWKHCVLVRSAGRTRLWCAYCGKYFLGGCIHRFKEHLARCPGNACCYPCVPHHVEDLMHRSLQEVAAKKLRKRSLAVGAAAYPGSMPTNMASPSSHAYNGQVQQLQVIGDMASPIHMVSLSQVVLDPRGSAPSSEMGWSGDTATASKRRKKALVVRRASATPPLAPHQQPAAPQQQFVTGLDAAEPPRHSDPAASDREKVSMAVGRFLYDVGVPLEVVNSVHFQPMIDAIASTGGRPLEIFSYHNLRGCVLKRSLDEVTAQLEFNKGSWAHTGCSVLADEWTVDRGRTLVNFSVYCPEGTMFLKSVDAAEIVTSPDALYELLKTVVEEVEAENVVQVIRKNSEVHAAAGEMLGETYPTLFWSQCSFLCIHGTLEDFSKVKAVSDIIGHAKAIT